jgi:hypothetical protein
MNRLSAQKRPLLTGARVGKPGWTPLVWGLACFLGVAWAEVHAFASHPFHISVAELEWNSQSRRIEVSLKLQSLDTDQALSLLTKQRVNIETAAEPGKLLERFLQANFFLVPADQVEVSEPREPKFPEDIVRSTVHYVGHELEVTWLWVYFELELDNTTVSRVVAENGEWLLVNSVLLDITEGQINTVSVRQQAKKLSKRTTIRQPWLKITQSELGVTVQ